ncbi:MAG: GNAT family N-acetyltransferase [Deltaproteobacteria bacterium]|nr:GNAT family N-acetyltransferase [Deltaproteobacteria bacterium]
MKCNAADGLFYEVAIVKRSLPTVEVLHSPPVTLWEKIIKNCEHATFFHSPTWVRILEKTYPEYSNATLGFVFSSGNRAILPLLAERPEGKFSRKIKHKSMALGVYGGIVAEKRLNSEETEALFEYLTSCDIRDLKLVENPMDQYTPPSNFVAKPMATHIVTLNSDFEQLIKRISRGRIRNIKEAEKRGVTVRLAVSLKDYEQYYHSYQESLKKWGDKTGTTYHWELFFNIFKTQDPGIKLWLAEKDEKIIAGVLAFYCNNTILLWHGYSLPEYMDDYPSSLLHMVMLKDGCANGYKHYDLNPSVERKGVIQFKESLSAKRLDFKAYHWKRKRLIPWKRKKTLSQT